MDRILAIPFLKFSSGISVSSTDIESLETAATLLLIELDRKKDDALVSISRFFCPLWILPLDESKALVFDGSDFSSSKIDIQILDFDIPSVLKKGDFFSFVSELEKHVKRAVSRYQSKPRGVKLKGGLGEDFASEIRDLLPKLEEWTNLKQFEVIEPSYTLDKGFLDTGYLEWFPTKSLVEREKQKHEATLELINSQIQSASEKYKSNKERYREKEAKFKSEAKEKLEKEREKRDSLIAKLKESKFKLKLPSLGTSLDSRVRATVKHSDKIKTLVETENLDKILKEIQNFIESVEELRFFLNDLEREYFDIRRELDRFHTEKEREIKRVQADFEARKREVERELQNNLKNLSSEIEDYEEAMERAKALKEQLATAFMYWKDKTEKDMKDYDRFTLPLKDFPYISRSFLIFIPFYVAEYHQKRKKIYGVISSVTITEKKIVRLKAISKLARKYQKRIEKGKINKKFEIGLRNYNYLLNPEIAQEFSKGINILEKLKVISPKMAIRVKNAYDQHFRIKLE